MNIPTSYNSALRMPEVESWMGAIKEMSMVKKGKAWELISLLLIPKYLTQLLGVCD